MTKKQLEDMGFHVTGKIVNGNAPRIWHGETETEFRVQDLKKMTAPEFINKFHSIAFEDGKSYGKILKAQEIKDALNIITNQ